MLRALNADCKLHVAVSSTATELYSLI